MPGVLSSFSGVRRHLLPARGLLFPSVLHAPQVLPGRGRRLASLLFRCLRTLAPQPRSLSKALVI